MSPYDSQSQLHQPGLYTSAKGGFVTSARDMAPGSGGRARAKQRKWRVLLAIGLLLPALAAIIGKCV